LLSPIMSLPPRSVPRTLTHQTHRPTNHSVSSPEVLMSDHLQILSFEDIDPRHTVTERWKKFLSKMAEASNQGDRFLEPPPINLHSAVDLSQTRPSSQVPVQQSKGRLLTSSRRTGSLNLLRTISNSAHDLQKPRPGPC
jgi:hypothetical protein